MVRIREVSPYETHSVGPVKSIIEKKGVHVQRYLGRTVLICEGCGQRLVLTDPDFLWHLEPLTLNCGCGEELTLAERIVEGGPGAGAAYKSLPRLACALIDTGGVLLFFRLR
jgi:hypothetical protein